MNFLRQGGREEKKEDFIEKFPIVIDFHVMKVNLFCENNRNRDSCTEKHTTYKLYIKIMEYYGWVLGNHTQGISICVVPRDFKNDIKGLCKVRGMKISVIIQFVASHESLSLDTKIIRKL